MADIPWILRHGVVELPDELALFMQPVIAAFEGNQFVGDRMAGHNIRLAR